MTASGVRAVRVMLGSGGIAAAMPAVGATGGALPGYFGQWLSGLALVVGAILILGWLLRRMPGVGTQAHQAIEILAVRAIGARERVLLIQVGTEQLLLGVAPSGIRCLHRLREPVAVASSPEPPGQEPTFARIFRPQCETRRAS